MMPFVYRKKVKCVGIPLENFDVQVLECSQLVGASTIQLTSRDDSNVTCLQSLLFSETCSSVDVCYMPFRSFRESHAWRRQLVGGSDIQLIDRDDYTRARRKTHGLGQNTEVWIYALHIELQEKCSEQIGIESKRMKYLRIKMAS
ncbi:hypothetical protein Nepgr_026458 [Nepenthes gracilis]|uniref:Uncharacterized protein n=1 Tax=Nepenthes gracilis TaxID=150966 RepID=A0AAD3Y223_NEPGR|nr:hypothetical protein Nepgr_026458 [Nepenthes gracilis]